jgi:hypothetical protein
MIFDYDELAKQIENNHALVSDSSEIYKVVCIDEVANQTVPSHWIGMINRGFKID